MIVFKLNYYSRNMINELYIIGTSHLDLNGPFRLRKLLEYINPDSVSVEMDRKRALSTDTREKILMYPQKIEKHIINIARKYKKLGSINKDTVKLYFQIIGYEYWIPRDYC